MFALEDNGFVNEDSERTRTNTLIEPPKLQKVAASLSLNSAVLIAKSELKNANPSRYEESQSPLENTRGQILAT